METLPRTGEDVKSSENQRRPRAERAGSSALAKKYEAIANPAKRIVARIFS
jgi:hypothetical protein